MVDRLRRPRRVGDAMSAAFLPLPGGLLAAPICPRRDCRSGSVCCSGGTAGPSCSRRWQELERVEVEGAVHEIRRCPDHGRLHYPSTRAACISAAFAPVELPA